MRGLLRAALLAIGLMLVHVQCVPAFTVSDITIDPSGPLVPGTPVVITGTIIFKPSSYESPQGPDDVYYYTDLERTTWTFLFFIDGKEVAHPSPLDYTGTRPISVISVPDFRPDAENFYLEGIAPNVTLTTNITLFRICEKDYHYNVVPGSCAEKTEVDVNTHEILDRLDSLEEHLSRLRTHIDKKAAMGVDTSEAEAKYAEADQHLKSASHLSYDDYLGRFKNIDRAETAITECEGLLDKAWAEKEIAEAKVPVQNAERVIGWFTGNESTRNDHQLWKIMTNRELALRYLETAEEELTTGNYSRAREKADDAFNKGNESYTDALQRSVEIQNPDYFSQILWFGIPLPCKCGPVFVAFELAIAVVITVIKIAVLILPVLGLYYLFRKRKGAKPE